MSPAYSQPRLYVDFLLVAMRPGLGTGGFCGQWSSTWMGHGQGVNDRHRLTTKGPCSLRRKQAEGRHYTHAGRLHVTLIAVCLAVTRVVQTRHEKRMVDTASARSGQMRQCPPDTVTVWVRCHQNITLSNTRIQTNDGGGGGRQRYTCGHSKPLLAYIGTGPQK